MKRRLLLATAVLAGMVGVVQCGGVPSSEKAQTGSGDAPSGDVGDAILAKACREHAAGLEVEGQGIVARILKDDTDGGRHQRFIVRLASGQTLLVAPSTGRITIRPEIARQDGSGTTVRRISKLNQRGRQ